VHRAKCWVHGAEVHGAGVHGARAIRPCVVVALVASAWMRDMRANWLQPRSLAEADCSKRHIQIDRNTAVAAPRPQSRRALRAIPLRSKQTEQIQDARNARIPQRSYGRQTAQRVLTGHRTRSLSSLRDGTSARRWRDGFRQRAARLQDRDDARLSWTMSKGTPRAVGPGPESPVNRRVVAVIAICSDR